MNHRVWIDPRITQVQVAGVRSYLTQRGWKLQEYPRPELLVFAGQVDDDGEPMIQVLPSDERMADYQMRVEELIEALSVVEDRPAPDILTEILQAGSANIQMPRNGEAAPTIPSPAASR